MGYTNFPTASSFVSLGPGNGFSYCTQPVPRIPSRRQKPNRNQIWSVAEYGYVPARRAEMMDMSGLGEDGGDGSQGPGRSSNAGRSRPSLRERVATSCSECRRRKQRCNQGQPCSNCARRFPPPVCEYRAAAGQRARSRLPANSPRYQTPTTVPDNVPIAGMSEPLLPPPGETLQVPTPVAYTPAPSSIGQWSDVALTTQYPSATSSSESASATIYGTTAGPWGPPPAWTTQEQMQMQPGNPFPSSPSMSSASFSPSLASTASPSMLNAQLMEHSHMQHVPKLLEAHNMIPQQFLPQGPSSAAVQGGDPTQFSLPWDMGGQLQWASTSALQAPMSDLSGIPVAPTKLNGELVHIFVKLLSRFKSSLDGNPDASNPYAKHYVPWCLSSQLLAHVALYTSACFLSETKNLDQMVATSLKGQAIGMLNEHLTGENRASDEVIAAVMQLILDEWYWGERQDLTAHLRGLRDMISLRGGIGALGLNGLLGKLVFSADRAISLSLESHPFLSASGSSLNLGDMASAPFRVPHNTPILPGQVTFAACADAVDLHVVTASILDDIRFLINTVLKLPHSPSKQEAKKLEATAKWIHNKISSLPPLSPFGGDPAAKNEDLANIPGQSQQNFLHQAIRLTSLIYTSAILQHRPLSQSCTTSQFLEIWTTAWRIPLTAWKGMLGVFLWLVFALVPTATKTEHSRFVKSMLTIACTQLGIENWAIAEPAMERMHMLQRWLSGSQHLNDTLQATSSGSAGPSGQTPPP